MPKHRQGRHHERLKQCVRAAAEREHAENERGTRVLGRSRRHDGVQWNDSFRGFLCAKVEDASTTSGGSLRYYTEEPSACQMPMNETDIQLQLQRPKRADARLNYDKLVAAARALFTEEGTSAPLGFRKSSGSSVPASTTPSILCCFFSRPMAARIPSRVSARGIGRNALA